MPSSLTRKLSGLVALDETDTAALDALSTKPRFFASGSTIIAEGDCPSDVYLLVDGWAARHKMDLQGNRQIVAFLLPGDLCDVYTFILKEMDHSITAVGDASVAVIPKDRVLRLLDGSAAIARGVWWSNLVDEAILREWLLNIGQRDAEQRLAHLLCEVWFRCMQTAKVADGRCYFPATQSHLAEALGLTSVHINRMLQRLRKSGAVALKERQLIIRDWEQLKSIADFSPRYLHAYQTR